MNPEMQAKRDPLFEFRSFNDWVNNAQYRFAQHNVRSWGVDVLDTKGRPVYSGAEMMRARDDGSFPVKVYLKEKSHAAD